MRRVLVLEAQVPFVHGGAEIHVRQLERALLQAGYEAEVLSLPFQDTPRDELLPHALAWRLLDLEQADVVIPMKFPCYFVRHPRKVAWLMHQHRAMYELCGTPFSDFQHSEADVDLRDRVIRMDTQTLGECVGLFSSSRTVASRLAKYNGLSAQPLYHPPKLADRFQGGPAGDYVFLVTRLEKAKRVDLAIEAFAHLRSSVRLVVAGGGSERHALDALIERYRVADRVQLVGRVSDEEVIRLYAGALAVLYPPFDEDFGYVTLEAFLSGKPVITTTDAGGPLEFVVDGESGFVTDPTADAIAERVDWLAAHRARAAEMGAAGRALARTITWDGVVETLVGAAGA